MKSADLIREMKAAGWTLDRAGPAPASAQSVPGGVLLRRASGTMTLRFR